MILCSFYILSSTETVFTFACLARAHNYVWELMSVCSCTVGTVAS